MKIKRLRIENFKRFRAPFELTEFSGGLNLFTAPNESGKSTIVEAIRSAFFERHRSTTVDHLRPWNDSSATPTVELEFDIDSKPYRLTKAFLGKKRCELSVDGKSKDGNAAEDYLAELLGFRLPGRGASAPEHMGIPGLLWIKQGTSHEITDTVRYANDYLQKALGESLGELASSGGDAVLKAVESERNELLTPATGAPRGVFQEALALKTKLHSELDALRRDIESYQAGVDRLSAMRGEYQRDEAARPWVALREQLSAAQQRLNEAKGLAEKKAEQEAVLKQAAAQANSWRTQLQSMEREEATLGQREQNLLIAQASLANAQGELHAWEPRYASAMQADSQAREVLRQARIAAARLAQEKRVNDLTEQLAALELRHEEARAEQSKLQQLQADAQTLAVPIAQLRQLRECSESLRTAQAKLDVVATALEFELQPNTEVRVAGVAVQGSSRQIVIGRTDIEIKGVGRLTVLPGGADLDSLAIERDRKRDELATVLQTLRAESLAAVEERVRLYTQRNAEAKASEAVLAVLAPKGLAALGTDTATFKVQLAEASQPLGAMPLMTPDEAAAPALTVEQAELEETAARAALESASSGFNDAKVATGNALAQAKAAEDEFMALKNTLSDPLRTSRKTEANKALTDGLAQQSIAQEKVDELARQLQAASLSLLEQDVERFAHSAKQSELAHSLRATEITRLEVELETKGALGLEEAAAEKQREFEHIVRRCEELQRRANALDHLLKLLRDKRSVLAQRLRAPLQKHLSHYLQILFPGAQIEVGEDLSPGRITRPGIGGPESGEFKELSVGAREQMGVVARLAYADLLKEAGKPTLLILDDALVHTDDQRLGQMKRVLYDAATRHQILIFSCHPDAWRDLGVIARSI